MSRFWEAHYNIRSWCGIFSWSFETFVNSHHGPMPLQMSFDHNLDPNSPLKKKHDELWIMNKISTFSLFFTYISFFAIIVNLNLNSLLIKIIFHHQFEGFHFLHILVFQESFYKIYIAFICHHFCFCYCGFAFLTTILNVLMYVCWYNRGVPAYIDDEVTLINLSDLLFDVLLLGVFRICVCWIVSNLRLSCHFPKDLYIYIGF